MIKRPFVLFIFILLVFSVFPGAPRLLDAQQTSSLQTAKEIEDILKAGKITYAQAARFAMAAAHIPGANRLTQEQAFRHAADRKWVPKRALPSGNLNLRQASLLILRAFEVRGGPQYNIFKTANFAYREMIYLDIIHDNFDPGMDVSGDLFLYLVSRVLYLKDKSPWELPDFAAELPEEIKKEEPKEETAEVKIIDDNPLEFSGSLSRRLLWLSRYAQDGEVYVISIHSDESIEPNYLYYNDKKVGITIRGDEAERTISLDSEGSMFSVGIGVTLTLENNITLAGRENNTDSLLKVFGGDVVINGGTKITGNSASYGGAVNILNGTFTMNGGVISGNSAFYGSGVYVGWGKTFTMNGGVISGNGSRYGGGVYVSSEGNLVINRGVIAGNSAHYGGGVYISSDGIVSLLRGNIAGNTAVYSGGGAYVNNGSFIMNGGVISGNTAGASGGGVYLFYYGFFAKTGGTIYGYDNSVNMNAVRDGMGDVVQSGAGNAVYASNSFGEIIRRKENNSGPEDILSMSYKEVPREAHSGAEPVWKGDWE